MGYMLCSVTEEQVVSTTSMIQLTSYLTNNNSLILTYLIPCRLITAHAIPSAALLAGFPGLAQLIGPLVACIRNGDLTGFDRALADGEPEFVRYISPQATTISKRDKQRAIGYENREYPCYTLRLL
jgi:hypothetical protein